MSKPITPQEHRRQIKAYAHEYPGYVRFKKALDRVLKAACKGNFPEAVVQTRAKSVSSFAEKAARKYDKYPDPVKDFNDLCGARIVVQTLSQVQAVRRFIEENFHVVETEDIGERLGASQFGYRDRHYIVQLKPELAARIRFTRAEITAIGERKAEVQVRTWVQHAWADTLHDRTYKAPLKLSTESSRTTALLAALMEDGDRNFDKLAGELDNRAANYATHADKSTVEKEIAAQELILRNEPDKKNKPRLALHLARLRAAIGKHDLVIRSLEKHRGKPSPVRDEIDLELGMAYCRVARKNRDKYRQGRELIESVVRRFEKPDFAAIPDLRRLNSLRARAYSRLGWIWETDETHANDSRECYRRALECEPGNPYYLADMIGFELRCSPGSEIIASMRTVIQNAIAVCSGHAADGIELPLSSLTAGRLRLLLGDNENALNDYLLGAARCLDGKGCFGCELVDAEVGWLHRVNYGKELPPAFCWAKNLLLLAKKVHACANDGTRDVEPLPAVRAKISEPVLIVAGGAASIRPEIIKNVRVPLTQALRGFEGTVISGGTKMGVPGLVGEVAANLRKTGGKTFRLLGYHPALLPDDAKEDGRYDELVKAGESGFTADQILANWVDLLGAGIKPENVRLIGIGGGPVSAVEYRVALVLGATVAVVMGSGGEADALLVDPLWKDFRNRKDLPGLLPLPFDQASIRAFIADSEPHLPEAIVRKMAEALHVRYLANNQHKIPKNLQPWKNLDKTYVNANSKQARYAIRILEAAGFGVRKAKGRPNASIQFTKKEIEKMAELEHGRWNVERLREGWRYGLAKDEVKHLNPCIVPWTDKARLPESIKNYDRDAVKLFPEILAKADFEIYRKPRRK
jgi:ppGpp synthetase/RelA/SpoT-type nucleotidyltranferase